MATSTIKSATTKPSAHKVQKKPELKTIGAANVKGSKTGVVESDARDKTRRVVVSFLAPHPKYGKFVRRRTILQVHDAANESRTGDVVEVIQCRPISKTKRWRLVRVVERRGEVTAALRSAKEVQ